MKALASLCLILAVARSEIRVSLNSDAVPWTVRNSNRSIITDARVPGGVYTDLRRAGRIPENLFYRFNDIELRWVGQDSWVYRAEFNLTGDVTGKSVVNLVFHGLDTVATVHLNGEMLGLVRNMFVRYVFPVKEHVTVGRNILEVKFKSPIVEARNLFDAHNYTVPPFCVPAHYNGECHVNFLRKMQASFAWDWGPAFPSVGIWKPVEIEVYDTALIRDVTTALDEALPGSWRLRATVYMEACRQLGEYAIDGEMETKDGVVQGRTLSEERRDDGGGEVVRVVEFVIPKESVDLWWPNGFGSQPLYHVNITFRSNATGETSHKSIRVGMRTIELVQETIRSPKSGLTFYFRVNGVPIFAKGSNWIPSHVLPELSAEPERIRHLLESSREAHMNILRVWGGGVYESDLFHEIADELGIMIWQDMMYACSMYPTNDEFLETVAVETVQQVRRLQHHASVALWAGNNENEAALRGNWYGTGRNFSLYKSDYVKLYVDTIKPLVEGNDPTRSYVVSSPSNGIMSEREGHVAKDPYSPLYGDVHFYNYILDPWNSNIYPNTRFASEYGFQSLPSMRTMSEVSLPGDRRIESQFSMKRQHLLAGYSFMTLQIKERLPLGRVGSGGRSDDGEESYETFVYYSQITQAMGIKTETEKYRRDRNKLTVNNEGRTMGAMYWQLNDVWQAPTWSSIDFAGRWKMSHYYAKRFFAPVLISPDLTVDKRVVVFLVSDLQADVPDAAMNVSVYRWDSLTPAKVITTTEVIRRSRSKIHARHDLNDLLASANCTVDECFVHVSLTAPGVDVDNVLYPTSFGRVENLRRANITTNVRTTDKSGVLAVELTTDGIAPFVWLETDAPGQFSDNGFTMVRPQTTVTFANRGEAIDVKVFLTSLTVRSLLG